MSYHYWYWRGTVAYFIPEVVQNLLAEISFGATLSAINNNLSSVPGEKLKIYVYFKFSKRSVTDLS